MTAEVRIEITADAARATAALSGLGDSMHKLRSDMANMAGAGSDAARRLGDLDSALIKLIQQEKNANTLKEAAGVFANMSAQEKAAALSAYELATAQEKAAKATENSIQKTGGLKLVWTELNSMWNLAQQGLRMVGEAFDATVGTTMKYGIEMRSLAQNIGTTTEEASRLVQALDDFGVPAESVGTAFEMMTKRGLAPSIDALAELADQYVAIQDPEERAALMSEKLGRNWTVLTPALREGGAAIREAAAAIDDSLIVTEEAAQQARRYQIAVDNLSDSWTAFTHNIGSAAAPATSGVMEWLSDTLRGGLSTQTGTGFLGLPVYTPNWKLPKGGLLTMPSFTDILNDTLNPGEPVTGQQNAQAWVNTTGGGMSADVRKAVAMGRTKNEAEELAKEMARLNTLMAGPVEKENKQFVQSQEKIQDALADSAKKLKQLQQQPWNIKGLEEEKKNYKELSDQYYQNAEDHKTAGKKIVFDIAQQQMAQDGLTKTEGKNLVDLAEKFGLLSEADAQLYDSVQGATDEMESGKTTAQQWLETMERLATEWTIKVNWDVNGNLPPGISGPVPVVKGKTGSKGGMGGNKKGNEGAGGASGMDFVVPQGYNENYPIRASSGERVTITPAGRASGGNGGSTGDVNIYGGRTYITVPGGVSSRQRLPRVRG